jgi:O-antigen ligase
MKQADQNLMSVVQISGRRFPVGIVFLVAMGAALAGYAFFGRGFAYLGAPPVFVGEVILIFGVMTWALTGGVRIFEARLSWLLILLMFIGALGTVPYIGTYGMDALRDGALWGYGLFAFLVGTFLLRGHDRILTVVRIYAKWLPWFLIWVPIAVILYSFGRDVIPRWPTSNVPMLNPKSGDIAVHLSGAMTFLALGLGRLYGAKMRGRAFRMDWLLWGLLIIGAVTILTGRAALLTIAGTALLLWILRPTKHWAKPVVIGIIAIVLALGFEAEFKKSESPRSVSPQALVQSFKSVFQETGTGYHDGSRRWRLEWWGDIWDYTVNGEYFWTGKGYGVNLADDDGYQVFGSGHGQAVLRSPHNSHLTFLARSGVPGFIAWIALQVLFGAALLRAYRKARRQGREDLAKLNLWVLAYWWAFMVNAGFDVFLEGPQGGIWFWSLFGFGLALLISQQSGSEFRGRNPNG